MTETTLTAPRPLGLTPYLIVADSRRAIDWYVEVLGARRRGVPMVMADGRVGHAELELGSATLFLADEAPQSHVAAPQAGTDATVSLVVEMPDVDAAVSRATRAGATVGRRRGRQPLRSQRRGPRPLRTSLDHHGLC